MRFTFRRPSAPMLVASLALFLAIGGVGYAQFRLAPGSVGTRQLKNGAVTTAKLANGAVGGSKLHPASVGPAQIRSGSIGSNQIDSSQVQDRVAGTCSGVLGAISAINAAGGVTCGSTVPQEYSTGSPSASLSGSPLSVLYLPGGSGYLVFAQAAVQVQGGTQPAAVEVDCTLVEGPAVGPSPYNEQIQKLVVDVVPGQDANGVQAAGTIPLMLAIPAGPAHPDAELYCVTPISSPGNPSISASTTIYAIQTA